MAMLTVISRGASAAAVVMIFIALLAHQSQSYNPPQTSLGLSKHSLSNIIVSSLNMKKKSGVDDMKEAMKYLETHKKKSKKPAGAGAISAASAGKGGRGGMSAADSRAALDSFSEDEVRPEPRKQETGKGKAKAKVYAQQTIWGQAIINCRPFKIDGKRTFEYLGSHADVKDVPTYALPEIAFLGRSNVGKSSLLNSITGSNKDIAVASKTPGRTRCINQFKCKDTDGDICTFVDLPGYGFAKIAKERQEDISLFLKGYLEDRSNLRMAVLLVDARREPQDQDLRMLEVRR
jgi:ribosome biogenesis GTP-binding protein YsxC/EngB